MKPIIRTLTLVGLGLLLSGCTGGKAGTSTEGQEQDLSGRIAQRVMDVQTLARLKNLGITYLLAANGGRSPRSFDDLLEQTERQPGMFLSARDKQQFEVVWGVNLSNVGTTGGGGNALLAWEKTAAPDGGRCVLMANCSTAQYLSKEDFEKAPKAKGR